MSNNQLNFEKWTTLLEPGPKDLPKSKKSAEVLSEPAPSQVVNEEPVATPEVLTVSQMTNLIKEQLENSFAMVWLRGEISNFTAHSSGHFYFSLKDNGAQISAVMFKGFNSRLKFKPTNGMEVIVRGRVTVFESRGNYQIKCETMEPVGAGALQKAFEQLKTKLHAEGLFDAKFKKPIPILPRHIGVVTSPTGAAIQDILNVLARRFRGARVTVIPAKVQGEGSAQEVVRGIELANRLQAFDVLIVGRGGGSVEDLWCFNEEIVARAIFASKIPIISAVGHEIDFTIADFVADLRAPTPSAAAEIVAKSAGELIEKINHLKSKLLQRLQFRLSQSALKLNHMQSRLVDPKKRLEDLSVRCDDLVQRLNLAQQNYLREQKMHIKLLREKIKNPQNLLSMKQQSLESLSRRLHKELNSQLTSKKEHLRHQMSILDSLSPLKVVQRGYAVVFDQGTVVREPGQADIGKDWTIEFSQIAVKVKVISQENSKFKKIEEELWTSKKN